MTNNYDPNQKRGGPANAGNWTKYENSDPEGALPREHVPADNALVQSIRDALPAGDPWREDPNRISRIGLSVFTEPGDEKVGALIREVGPQEAINQLWTTRGQGFSNTELNDAVARAVRTARQQGLGVTTAEDPTWPKQLNDLGDGVPLALWSKGDLSILTDAAPDDLVTITGARASTPYGEHVGLELAAGLAEAGKTNVSGAAFGHDAVAHRAALASGGKTIAVLASGVDTAYPAHHTDLLGRIAEKGLILSERLPGQSPDRNSFLQRNRITAALSSLTVIVEAGPRSGSLGTAAAAHKLGRLVAAVPGPVTSAASTGSNQLLADGTASLVTGYRDVLALQAK